jgi:hypothetical protein
VRPSFTFGSDILVCCGVALAAGVSCVSRFSAVTLLSGRYARFGSQDAQALRAWAALDGGAELVLEDDRSDSGMLQTLLPTMAAGCDVLLGPYSTQLARVAGKMSAGAGWLICNHGVRG